MIHAAHVFCAFRRMCYGMRIVFFLNQSLRKAVTSYPYSERSSIACIWPAFHSFHKARPLLCCLEMWIYSVTEISQLNRSEKIPPFSTTKKKPVLGNIDGPILKKFKKSKDFCMLFFSEYISDIFFFLENLEIT